MAHAHTHEGGHAGHSHAAGASNLRLAFFFNLGLGGAVNNGTRHSSDPVRKSLGSHVLFHVSGEIGLRVTRHVAVSVDFNHSSNAGLSRYNQSINDAGVRLGWRF